jgi:hypothetical protein
VDGGGWTWMENPTSMIADEFAEIGRPLPNDVQLTIA